MTVAEQQGADVLLRVRVQPKASRDALKLEPDGRLRIALTAPPVDGAANDALAVFLSRQLHIAKRRVALEHGERSRDKTVRISAITTQAVLQGLGIPCD